jgi:hypothetical protein
MGIPARYRGWTHACAHHRYVLEATGTCLVQVFWEYSENPPKIPNFRFLRYYLIYSRQNTDLTIFTSVGKLF